MPYEVLRAESVDLPTLIEIHFSAMDDNPLQQCLWPGGNAPEARQTAVDHYMKDWNAEPNRYFLKCVDTETGQIAGYAQWIVNPHERPESEWMKIPTVTWLEEGPRKEMADLFVELNMKKRQKYMQGRPYCALNMLATHLDHRRRGVGTALVRWGCETADEFGIEAYLEATPTGLFVYEKNGFEKVDVVDLDLSPWEGKIPLTTRCRSTMMHRTKKTEP